jgi:ABC-type nitrate/sulfonate/bicarbonate transport system permease component
MNQITEAITGMQDHAPLPALTRLYKNNERLVIGGGTLLVFLLAWEALAESGFIDPLFISSPAALCWRVGGSSTTRISGTMQR